jgi:hypothetical protein
LFFLVLMFQSLAAAGGLGAMRPNFAGLAGLQGAGLSLQQATALANQAAYTGLPAA